MTSGDNGEWVRQGTPHDDEANWNEEPSEYGTAISPVEWDDYSSEQSVPVAPPRAHADGGAETAGSPGSPFEQDVERVPAQEPDAVEEYHSDEIIPPTQGETATGADHDGLESSRIDEPEHTESEQHEPEAYEASDVTDALDDDSREEYATDEPVHEMIRPRPVVHDAQGATAVAGGFVAPEDAGQSVADDVVSESAMEPMDGGMDPVAEDQMAGEERHIDAAEYLAVDPVPADQFIDEPLMAADEPAVTTQDEPLVTSYGDEPQVAAVEDEPLVASYGDDPQASAVEDEPLVASYGDDPQVEAVEDDPLMTSYDDDPQASTVDDEPLPTVDDDDPQASTVDDEPLLTVDDDEPQAVTVDDEAIIADDNDVDEETDVTGTEDEPDLVVVDDELTQQVDMDDMEATQAVPLAAAAPGATEPVADGLYRVAGSEQTAVIGQNTYPSQDSDVEEERQQAQLEAERQAREQRLGAVPTSSDNAIREDTGPAKLVTDKLFPSFGLFVLRIVLAGILGVASYQILGSGVDATADYLGRTMIPEPRLVAWILGFTLGAMALLLVIGMLQRLVGLLLLVIAVGSLIFVRWGNFAIFNAGVEGFVGDKDLLLAAVGLLLLTLGGGMWGVDGAFRRTRAASKAERQD